jgi:hypothetical protein
LLVKPKLQLMPAPFSYCAKFKSLNRKQIQNSNAQNEF